MSSFDSGGLTHEFLGEVLLERLKKQQNRFWKKLQEGRLAKIDNLNLDKITLTVCDTEAVIPTIIFKDCTILLSYQHLHHHHILPNDHRHCYFHHPYCHHHIHSCQGGRSWQPFGE